MASPILALNALLLLICAAQGCRFLDVKSSLYGTQRFEMMSEIDQDFPSGEEYLNTGRQVYKAKDSALSATYYLYHVILNERSGDARWLMNTEFNNASHAVAYSDSWAITPYTIPYVNDQAYNKSSWHVVAHKDDEEEGGFVIDQDMSVECAGMANDRTIYFDSSPIHQPGLSGFYIETIKRSGNPSTSGQPTVYAQIRSSYRDVPLYMYLLGEDTWMIGEEIGVDRGLAFTRHSDLVGEKEWKYISIEPQTLAQQFIWVEASGTAITTALAHEDAPRVQENKEGKFLHIYDAVRYFRSISHLPAPQEHLSLHNGVPLPAVGLGTGGIFHEELEEVLTLAINAGYRSFDLAREYRNEELFANTMQALASDIHRSELFLISKVWPTELGTVPTRDAVLHSLRALRTNYIDAYLLHWPSCNPEIEWMHCQDTIDVHATWRESWRALEREYAEGRVMSIGVSNFDAALLQELNSMAYTNAHIVQNWAEPGRGKQDVEVRRWCHQHGIIYQPYAHQRNLRFLSKETKETMNHLAQIHSTSTHVVSSRFFLQTGASIIPRSRDKQHLEENLNKVFGWQISYVDMQELGWNANDIQQSIRTGTNEEL